MLLTADDPPTLAADAGSATAAELAGNVVT